MPVALITGASRGLGRAAVRALADRGWSLVADARREDDLAEAVRGFPDVVAIAGDVTSPGHRADLPAAIRQLGRLDVLVNTPTSLGSTPRPPRARHELGKLRPG